MDVLGLETLGIEKFVPKAEIGETFSALFFIRTKIRFVALSTTVVANICFSTKGNFGLS